MLSGIGRGCSSPVRPLTFASLEHSCVSMATPGTEACDAVGGALGPKWRELPSRSIGGYYPSRLDAANSRPLRFFHQMYTPVTDSIAIASPKEQTNVR
jgi:hypothetical protein